MFGFDSVSRNAFIRKLPKSYKYLVDSLGAHVLKGYNIVGDGTPQALIPILTGKTELELPDTRKRIEGSKYVNVYPFIWDDFRESGYVTGFMEDCPLIGTFQYRLKGFSASPTDHYMRPYYLLAQNEYSKWPKLCAGSIPRHKVMMNYIKNFFNVYKSKPKFLFGFHGELSHDNYNLVGTADGDLLNFLKDLKRNGALDNTLLIIMADHGHRFAEIRDTIQGKQEERLPFFSFTFPQWFKKKHSQAYRNLVANVERLTTPFDVYLTLRDVIDYNGNRFDNRSLSLFSKIPENRSCYQAYIEPHWCACLEWTPISTDSSITKRLGETVVNAINEQTKTLQHLCERLRLASVEWAMKLRPNENVLKFKQNADYDGFVPDMSGTMAVTYDVYQVKVHVVPGESIFEASVTHHKESDEMSLKMSDISRVNMYGEQARCIMEKNPDLRKYCFCKD